MTFYLNFKPEALDCTLCADEMALKTHLFYSLRKDEIACFALLCLLLLCSKLFDASFRGLHVRGEMIHELGIFCLEGDWSVYE